MRNRSSWVWDRRVRKKGAKPPAAEPKVERRSGQDRRTESRIRLSLEVAVPVVIRAPDWMEYGLARNISEGGMLIQVRELPAIGARLEITISGVHGSRDAPEAVTLVGEVRHHIAWQFKTRGHTQTMKGIGVRFSEKPNEGAAWPDWVWSAGETVH
jgi:hypothetical protein